MEKLQRRSQSENVPVELIHLIQSLLPVKEAVRTCVLSKTWSHAWSTIPHLRFHNKISRFPNEEKERDYVNLMDLTVFRYAQDNIPIVSFYLKLDSKYASLAYKWIRTVAAQSCLKELSLEFCDGNYILLDDIFSVENLPTMLLRLYYCSFSSFVTTSSNHVIHRVSLRILELEDVKISEEVLDTLISTCTLLEKISLSRCLGLKTYNVRNLRYIKELKINSTDHDDILIIDDVPNLRLFSYYSLFNIVYYKPIRFNMASLTSVTELSLHGVIIDVVFLDMIKLKLNLLEILGLTVLDWPLERLEFTSFSLKRLTLIFRCIPETRQTDIQVNAPKLLLECSIKSQQGQITFF
ncbi:F-box/LRR-repeat protein 25-like [Rutidosis leptorrhynchoides]|uniref:F-box/LRR-repeat protein 25-like n=1 Tax=Rutidosis leptorrhynchoides TaxID=125765 RepID=UPI003A998DE9